MLSPWWKRLPDRLEYELRALDQAGIVYELDQQALEGGVALLRLDYNCNGERLRLEVKFPDFYPYTRFEIIAPGIELNHHQNPFCKNLCLIGGSSENWETTDTVADYLKNRLPVMLSTARTELREQVAGLEEHQGEPMTAYYPHQVDSVVLVDSSWAIPGGTTHGRMTIGLFPDSGVLLRGAVLEIRDSNNHVLAQADPAIVKLCPKSIPGRWVRADQPIKENEPDKFLRAVPRNRYTAEYVRSHTVQGGYLDIVGVVFPEEVSWRESSDGWVFVVRGKQKATVNQAAGFSYFARAARSGLLDLASRQPALYDLRSCCVAVVGLGCIGAPSVLEFARAGVRELRLLDHDIIEPGNSVRWPFGISVAGRNKAQVLKMFLHAHYPFTEVKVFPHKIGDVLTPGQSDLKVLSEFLQDVDLIYDATAEIGIQHLMSDLARERSVPFVCISSTNGGWGGRILRVVPGTTQGCWYCSRLWMQEDRLPIPPADPGGPVQPHGCASPTFTGFSFDLQEVSLAGVRLAVATLSSKGKKLYPDFGWDGGVLSLRDNNGQPLPATWKTFSLHPHPKCSLCNGI